MINYGKVSVIIPVYNVERYLCDCLESVVNQTYKNIEIILIDDGSTDKSSEICKRYEEKHQNIKYLFQKNQGLSAARNQGLNICTGEYVYFLDSDDFIVYNAIEIMVREIKDDIDIISAGFLFVNEGRRYHNDKVVSAGFQTTTTNAFYRQIISNHAWGKLYRKSLFDDIKYPVGQNYEDVATTHKLFCKSNRVVYTNKELYFYRIRNGAITQTPTEKNIMDFIRSYESVKVFYKSPHDEEVDYYMMTILYNIYSRIFRSNIPQRRKYFKYVRNEFRGFRKVRLIKYINVPMTIKLILYRIGAASLFMRLVDMKREMTRGLLNDKK